MKNIYALIFSLSVLSLQASANTFNCNVADITLNSGAPGLVFVTMGCTASNPIQSGTNGCTAATISNNRVAIDSTTALGKLYYALALSALATQKQTLIATFGTCPSGSPDTPAIYSMKVSN